MVYWETVSTSSDQTALPDDVRVQHELLDEHRFRSGVVHLRYGSAFDHRPSAACRPQWANPSDGKTLALGAHQGRLVRFVPEPSAAAPSREAITPAASSPDGLGRCVQPL